MNLAVFRYFLLVFWVLWSELSWIQNNPDRGNELKNKAIENLLNGFGINRLLTKKGCSFDKAVAEALFKTFKKEFIYPNIFEPLDHLQIELFEYVKYDNNKRLYLLLEDNVSLNPIK